MNRKKNAIQNGTQDRGQIENAGIHQYERLRQEDLEFEASLDYSSRPCLKINIKNVRLVKNVLFALKNALRKLKHVHNTFRI